MELQLHDTMTEQISPASFFFFIFKGSSLSPYDSRYIWTTLVVLCVKATPSPTIAAAAGDQDVRRRGLSWAWAEGVQAVERVLAAVAWRGERVAALRVPAVDVAAVPDAAFRALCLLRLLNMVNTCTGHIKCTNSCGKRKTLNISCKEHWLDSCCVFYQRTLSNMWGPFPSCSPQHPTVSVITLSSAQSTLPVCLQAEHGANGRWGKAFPVY